MIQIGHSLKKQKICKMRETIDRAFYWRNNRSLGREIKKHLLDLGGWAIILHYHRHRHIPLFPCLLHRRTPSKSSLPPADLKLPGKHQQTRQYAELSKHRIWGGSRRDQEGNGLPRECSIRMRERRSGGEGERYIEITYSAHLVDGLGFVPFTTLK